MLEAKINKRGLRIATKNAGSAGRLRLEKL